MEGEKELHHLCLHEWARVKIPQSRKQGPYYLDIVFETEKEAVKIRGNPVMKKDNTDTFGLHIGPHRPETWWANAPDTRDTWIARDLSKEWRANQVPVCDLHKSSRKVRFYTSHEFDEVIEEEQVNILWRCLAIEFVKSDDPNARLLITAEMSNVSIFTGFSCSDAVQDYFIEYRPNRF